jgi:FkbM family methyltransferase
VNPHVRIVAFEPMPAIAERLISETRGMDIELARVAATDVNAPLTFQCDGQRSSISDTGITVPDVTVDSWMSGEPVGLIKIDVERASARVLHGARETILRYRPVIICEVLSDEVGREVAAALPSDYHYYRIDENRGVERRSLINREHWAHKNWLFTAPQP